MQVATVQAVIDTLNNLAKSCEREAAVGTPLVMAHYQGKLEGYRNSARILDQMLATEVHDEAEAAALADMLRVTSGTAEAR